MMITVLSTVLSVLSPANDRNALVFSSLDYNCQALVPPPYDHHAAVSSSL
jgi:hypothetical protein